MSVKTLSCKPTLLMLDQSSACSSHQLPNNVWYYAQCMGRHIHFVILQYLSKAPNDVDVLMCWCPMKQAISESYIINQQPKHVHQKWWRLNVDSRTKRAHQTSVPVVPCTYLVLLPVGSLTFRSRLRPLSPRPTCSSSGSTWCPLIRSLLPVNGLSLSSLLPPSPPVSRQMAFSTFTNWWANICFFYFDGYFAYIHTITIKDNICLFIILTLLLLMCSLRRRSNALASSVSG